MMKYDNTVLPLLPWNLDAVRDAQAISGIGCLGVVLLTLGVLGAVTGILLDGCQDNGIEASFLFDPASGPAPLTVSFVDTSTSENSPITEWAWTFGDGGTSDKSRPSHTYVEPGEYTVSLAVTTVDGSDTFTVPNCITVIGGVEGEIEGENVPDEEGETEGEREGEQEGECEGESEREGEDEGEGEGESNPNGALKVTILPAEVVEDGAIWTLDHGFHYVSGATVQGVASGRHTVSFKDMGAGWITPAEQNVEVFGGQTTEVTGRYTVVRNIGDEKTFAGIVFKWIPPGTYYMGSAKTSAELSAIYGDRESFFDPEHPQHQVTITRGFWLGKYEVTQAQWSARMAGNPSGNVGSNLPVEQVSWDDCQVFIAQLNLLGEGVFRLPTEAEWEYACRAGTDTEFYWGDDVSVADNYAWRCLNVYCTTQPVGKLIPNAWGLYDMSGNVREWCSDCYDPEYYTEAAVIDPQGPEPPVSDYIRRVRRGGGTVSSHDIAFCRSAMRYSNIQQFAQPDTGFRLVRESGD